MKPSNTLHHYLARLTLTGCIAFNAGCASHQLEGLTQSMSERLTPFSARSKAKRAEGTTLGDLQPIDLSSLKAAKPTFVIPELKATTESELSNLDKVIQQYEQALRVSIEGGVNASDADQSNGGVSNDNLRVKLAFSLLERGELLLAEGETEETLAQGNQDLIQSAELLRTVIAKKGSSAERAAFNEQRDRWLYHRAQALYLVGQQSEAINTLRQLTVENPQSKWVPEAYFRIGEYQYSRQQYQAAELAYGQAKVLAPQGPDADTMALNALYMQGWSTFKSNQLDKAQSLFDELLQAEFQQERGFDLEDTFSPIVEDSLRAQLLILNYSSVQQGLDTLFSSGNSSDNSSDNADKGKERPHYLHPHYRPILHHRLAKHLYKNERFYDASLSYQHYLDQFPHNYYAPKMQLANIKQLLTGNFHREALESKKIFAHQYGPRSAFYEREENQSQLATLAPIVSAYQLELAEYYHALAQKAKQSDKQQDHYIEALNSYQTHLNEFPDTPNRHAIQFKLAEVAFAVGRYETAIKAYETVAYGAKDQENAGNNGEGSAPLQSQPVDKLSLASQAAYNAIVAHQKLVETTASTGSKRAEPTPAFEAKLNSQLQFIDQYQENPNHAAVSLTTIDELLKLKRFTKSIGLSQTLLQQTHFSPKQQLKLWEALSFSFSQQGDLANAEQAYLSALKHISQHRLEQDKEVAKSHLKLYESYASTLYQQGDQLHEQEDWQQSIEKWQQIITLTPHSKLVPQALFEIGTIYLNQESWAEAVKPLVQLRKQFPDHSLTPKLPPKLALAYQEQGFLAIAADEVNLMRQTAQKHEERASLTLLAADLYDRSQRYEPAIDLYRQYIRQFNDDPIKNLFTQEKMVKLYETTNQPKKRRYWLNSIVTDYFKGTEETQTATRALAAKAQSELARQPFEHYKAVKLTLPLDRSFQQKERALKAALTQYEKLIEMGDPDYNSEAYFHIGELYRLLSTAIMDSERPNNLNELELEEYEIMLEEQAYPFDDQAIEIHEQNSQQSWDGLYNAWIANSFEVLSKLAPATYDKKEKALEYSTFAH